MLFKLIPWIVGPLVLLSSCGRPQTKVEAHPSMLLTETLVTAEQLESAAPLAIVRPGDEVSVILKRRDTIARFRNYQRPVQTYNETYRGIPITTGKCGVGWRDFKGYQEVQKMPGEDLESLPLKIKLGDNLYPFEKLVFVSKENMVQKAFFWVQHHHLQSDNQLSLVVEQPPARRVRVGFTGHHRCGRLGINTENGHRQQQVQDKITFEMRLSVRGMP